MSEQKGMEVGPPIFVESIMTIQEWKERVKKYPTSSLPEPPQYIADKYKGGVWRKGMGASPSKEEMTKMNKEIESLKQFNLCQKEH